MKVSAFIGKVDGAVKWSDVVSRLEEAAAYNPVFKGLRNDLGLRLAPLGVKSVPTLGPIDSSREIYLSEDGLFGFIVRLSNREPRRDKNYIEVLGIGLSEVPDVQDIFGRALSTKLDHGSYKSFSKITKLQHGLGELSVGAEFGYSGLADFILSERIHLDSRWLE